LLAVGKLLPDGVAAANEMLAQGHLTQNPQGQRPQACRLREACIACSRMHCTKTGQRMPAPLHMLQQEKRPSGPCSFCYLASFQVEQVDASCASRKPTALPVCDPATQYTHSAGEVYPTDAPEQMQGMHTSMSVCTTVPVQHSLSTLHAGREYSCCMPGLMFLSQLEHKVLIS